MSGPLRRAGIVASRSAALDGNVVVLISPKSSFTASELQARVETELAAQKSRSPQDALLAILSHYSVCSKEWVIRQYDHEVQSCSVVKPLVGIANDGPSDAAVIMPVLGSWTGAAIGCGINPRYGDLDPYSMAAAAIDEAARNVVAVGADPARIAILDNFCWNYPVS